MSDSNQTQLSYAPNVFGQLPSTGWKYINVTSESFIYTPNWQNTGEIRNDGNVADRVIVGAESSGSFDFVTRYGLLDDFLEGVLLGAFDSNDILKNGRTNKPFAIQKHFGGPGVTKPYHVYRDMTPNSLSLTVPARGTVTGTVGFTGTVMTTSTSRQGNDPAAASTDPVMVGSNAAIIVREGGAVTPDKITTLTLNLDNQIRPREVIGSQTSESFGHGNIVATGTFSAYFRNGALIDKFVAGTKTSLQVPFSDGTKSYTFLFPNVTLDTGNTNVSSVDTDVMAEFSFTALFDSTESATVKVTRDDGS